MHKSLIIIAVFISVISCQQKSEYQKQLLNKLANKSEQEFNNRKTGCLMAIQDSPANNEVVLGKIELLDSLRLLAISNINSETPAASELKNFISLTKELKLRQSEEELAHGFPDDLTPQLAVIELSLLSTDIISELAAGIKQSNYMFDEVDIFLEPSKSTGNKVELKVYFAAYNSRIEDVVNIFANGEPVKVTNGIGLISVDKTAKEIEFLVSQKAVNSPIADLTTVKPISHLTK